MNKTIFLAFLRALGVPEPHVKTIEDNWDKTDFTLDQATIVNEFNAEQKAHYMEDPDIVSEIDRKAKGREKDIAERLVKKAFALTPEETKDKDFAQIVDIAKTKATANSNKTLQELQDKLLVAENEVVRLNTEVIPGIQTQADSDRKKINVENMFDKMANDIALELQQKNPKALRLPLPTILKNTKLLLASEYDFDQDEKDANVLVVKDKKGLKVKPAGSNTYLTPKDAMLNLWKENQFIAESNAPDDTNNKKKPPVVPANNGGGDDLDDEQLLKKFPHAQGAMKHLETLKTKPKD